MRTVSEGAVKLTFDVITKDMHQFGFERGDRPHSSGSSQQLHVGVAANADLNVLAGEYSSLADQAKSRRL